MNKPLIYLDHAAATPLDPQVRSAMQAVEHIYANPSAQYSAGLEANELLEQARAQIARMLNCRADEIIFTSGGSEADNLAIFGSIGDDTHGEIITIETEHKAILAPINRCVAQGMSVKYVQLDQHGMVNLADFAGLINPTIRLVAIALTSSEVGTIQPIAQIAKLVVAERKRRFTDGNKTPIHFHCDGSAVGESIRLDVNRLGIDSLSLNPAKLYGPKGVGLLYLRRGSKLTAQLLGGSQENGLRAGTPNLVGVVGMAKSLEIAQNNSTQNHHNLQDLSQYLVERLIKMYHDIAINGHPKKHLAGHISISFDKYDGEDLMAYLNDNGVAVGTGAACSASDEEPSRAIRALGRTRAQAQGTLRITLGRYTTKAELDQFLKVLEETTAQLDGMKHG